MAAIDMNFISTFWDGSFPSSQVRTLPRLGINRTAFVVDSWILLIPKVRQFGFKRGVYRFLSSSAKRLMHPL